MSTIRNLAKKAAEKARDHYAEKAKKSGLQDSGLHDGIEFSTPKKIEGGLLPVPPFDFDLLPSNFRTWIEDNAYRMQVPPDYIAASTLVTLGVLIAGKCVVKPKQFDNWEVVPNLWGLVIGEPSQLKSPAIELPFSFLLKLEAKENEAFKTKQTEHNVDKEMRKVEREQLKKQLAKATDKGAIKEKLMALDEKDDTPPTRVRYKTNDPTVPMLQTLLAANPSGILVWRDELMGLLKSMEQQGRESDRAFYLEGWSGNNKGYTVDRVGTGTKDLERVCISVFGSSQPDKFNPYIHAMRKGDNDGLIQRFQVAVFPDKVHRKHIDTVPNQDAHKEVEKVFLDLANFNPDDLGAKRSDDDGGLPYLRFSTAAAPYAKRYAEDLEAKIQDDDTPTYIRQHLGKYRSLMPSIALIIHVITELHKNNKATDGISEAAANMAINWCNYLEKHAARIYAHAHEAAAPELAKKLIRSIGSTAPLLPNPFKMRDVQRKGWEMLTDKATILSAIEELTDLGWLHEFTPEKGMNGRPPAKQYYINPAIKKIKV